MMSEKLIALWNGSLAGRRKNYSALHVELYPKLFMYASKMLHDDDLVDDLLQDLFVKFWENRGKIGPIKNVEAYFYRSTRSMVLNHIRLKKHRDSKLIHMSAPEHVFSTEDIIISNESNSLTKELVLSALNRLPAKQREILNMRFYDELSYPQIAKVLGIRYQSVINHVYRAVQSLRQASELSALYAA
ncbi:RNA polymerase sigma-70 factor (ECF subfamily) [Pedobacter sp. AK017]|uniref:RNA polymerase sigma factor n=1 Tax=Pedobacter sp. AK017 TaxID=2723073 RepID=UPI0016194080|nr:sigma-70 family RNA polymerase sigma factor [Pedobacter sp. AK017]MBB5440266.1 RNA polymerase sigma-70 factor (ECF subfamily) [Pedobacter sp. AK017]